eukprot:514031-Rhodomonas_salina.1
MFVQGACCSAQAGKDTKSPLCVQTVLRFPGFIEPKTPVSAVLQTTQHNSRLCARYPEQPRAIWGDVAQEAKIKARVDQRQWVHTRHDVHDDWLEGFGKEKHPPCHSSRLLGRQCYEGMASLFVACYHAVTECCCFLEVWSWHDSLSHWYEVLHDCLPLQVTLFCLDSLFTDLSSLRVAWRTPRPRGCDDQVYLGAAFDKAQHTVGLGR